MELLRENIISLLDCEALPSSLHHRVQYLSNIIELDEENLLSFFQGSTPLPPGVARRIADHFGVDVHWLVGRA